VGELANPRFDTLSQARAGVGAIENHGVALRNARIQGSNLRRVASLL
jgi:hypothetical protein